MQFQNLIITHSMRLSLINGQELKETKQNLIGLGEREGGKQ